MPKSILNVAAISLGSDGRVEIADEQLVAIERSASFAATAGGTGTLQGCQSNSGCGSGSTLSNTMCSNDSCAAGDDGATNEACENYACDYPPGSNWSCMALSRKPF